MAVTLGGVTLNPSIQWTNRDAYTNVLQRVKRTLGGSVVIYATAIDKGMPIILEAPDDTGWLDYSVVVSLLALAANPSGQYALDFHGTSYTVMFDNRDGEAVSFRPIQRRVPQADTDKCIGTIKLFTI